MILVSIEAKRLNVLPRLSILVLEDIHFLLDGQMKLNNVGTLTRFY